MYPFLRLAATLAGARGRIAPEPGKTHVTRHVVLPVDIDVWGEMNHGQILTLYEMGRFALFARLGFIGVMRREGWAGTVAGASVRYRRRMRLFQRYEMRTAIAGWDDRFVYFEQSMWRKGQALSHLLVRTAVTDRKGIVPPARVAGAMDLPAAMPLPDWATAWTEADALRPWPPMADDAAAIEGLRPSPPGA